MILPAKRLNKTQTNALLKQVNRVGELSAFTPETTKAFSIELPFYQKAQLVELIDIGILPAKSLSLCSLPEGVCLVEYGPNPFHHVNKLSPLLLSIDTVCAYLTVYLKFLRLPEGQIQPVENLEKISLREDLPPNQRKVLAQTLKPLSVTNNGFPFKVEGSFLFQTSLFHCVFSVQQTGDIKMVNRELLLADLPVVEEALRA